MKLGGVEKTKIRLSKGAPQLVLREREAIAQGFKKIGAPTLGTRGAMAVLGDLRPGSSGNQTRRRRDIKAPFARTPSAAGVDKVVVSQIHGTHARAHGHKQ